MPRTKKSSLYLFILHLTVAFLVGIAWPLYFIWGMSQIPFVGGLVIYLLTAGAAIIATFMFVWSYVFFASDVIIQIKVAESEH